MTESASGAPLVDPLESTSGAAQRMWGLSEDEVARLEDMLRGARMRYAEDYPHLPVLVAEADALLARLGFPAVGADGPDA